MYNNANILAAVLNKWAQPLVGTFLSAHMQSFPLVQGIQNKIRAMGWVGPNWSLFSELSPIMEGISGNLIAPIISKYISQVDDALIPKMAHSIVDNALANGELRLFEGKIIFEAEDLRSLKRLLELNMPYSPEEDIAIKTE